MVDWATGSLEKCVSELVLNSLEAKATAIAVRIDVRNRKIQVVDNGSGIDKDSLRNIGEYPAQGHEFSAFNKTRRITRGRSLVNIRVISSVLMIMSKSQADSKTYGKIFSYGQTSWMTLIEDRPTGGTTVTVYFSRESRDWCDKIDSFAMRYIIACLALVNKEVSFSVRDDSRRSILLRIGKHQKSRHLLRVICEQPVNTGQISSIKIRVSARVKITCFWGFDCTKSRKIQQVLVNLRPVRCSELEKVVLRTVTYIYGSCTERESINSDKIFFLLYIESSNSEYNLSVKNGRFIVEFDHIDKIVDSIDRLAHRVNHSKQRKRTRGPDQLPVSSPIGRISKSKLKRRLLTNIASHSFEHKTIFRKNEQRSKAETKNQTDRCNEDAESNSEDDQRLLRSQSRDQSQSTKDCRDAISDELPMDRKCNEKSIEKLRCDTGRPISQERNLNVTLPVRESANENFTASRMSQNFERSQSSTVESALQKRNSDETLTANIHDHDDHVGSRLSNKLIERLQDSGEPRRVSSQSITRGSTLKEYQFDNHSVSWISQKCVEKLSNSVEEMYTLNDCSQWSDWIYEPDRTNCNETQHSGGARQVIFQRFRFLPVHLHALLPYRDVKMIGRTSPEMHGVTIDRFNMNFKHRRQDLEVRPCIRRSFEIRLSLESLHSMKVLNQVNNEFIIGSTKQDGKKLLVIIDQHAMDERLRYEELLRAYRRDQKNRQFTFVTLHRPIIISDLSPSDFKLISANQRLLVRYGLNVALRNDDALLIFTVPRCFSKKSYHADNSEMENVVRKLMQEILDGLNSNGIAKFLPLTIHDALAREACHGAIKFGDPLTVKQCERLVSCWKETEAPNRCAHGRPSMIPLLEVSSVKRDLRRLSVQEKLNFASLRNSRKRSGCTFNERARYHPYDRRTVPNFEEFPSDDETSR